MNKMKLALLILFCSTAGGCMSQAVDRIGKHDRHYGRASAAAIGQDGSLVVICNEFHDDKIKGSHYLKKTHRLVFSAKSIRGHIKFAQEAILKDPKNKERYLSDDGLPIVEIGPVGFAVQCVEEGRPALGPGDNSVQLIPSQRRFDYRKRLRYDYESASCWVLMPESFWENYEDPGSGITRAILIGPAKVGDFVTMPIQVIIIGIALSQQPMW